MCRSYTSRKKNRRKLNGWIGPLCRDGELEEGVGSSHLQQYHSEFEILVGHLEIKRGIIPYQFLAPHKFDTILNNVMFIVFPWSSLFTKGNKSVCMDKYRNFQINILRLLVQALPSGRHYFSCTNLKTPSNLMTTHGKTSPKTTVRHVKMPTQHALPRILAQIPLVVSKGVQASIFVRGWYQNKESLGLFLGMVE